MSAKAKTPFLKIVLGIVVVLLALVILVPNILRSRMTGDPPPGGAGGWNVRSINTAEITYAMNFEKVGYAPDLAVLGPAGTRECSPEHACLLDFKLACPEGIGNGWCVKDGYRFNIQSSSKQPPYKDYWVTATPIEANPKLKNYCSTEDAVIHRESAAPLKQPYRREECLAVSPDPNGYHP
jgi:hypothetical protein